MTKTLGTIHTIDCLILSLFDLRMGDKLYKWLCFVCPLGLTQTDVEFKNSIIDYCLNSIESLEL